jgi:hypothetical protein
MALNAVQECFVESLWYDTTQFCFRAAMSAVAIAYTSLGFAVAADGRQTSKAALESEVAEDEVSDGNQKIFKATTASGAAVAYALTGFIAKDASYDLIRYAKGHAKRLSSGQFRSGDEYCRELSDGLKRYIESEKRDGVIKFRENEHLEPDDRFLIASLHMIGYFHGSACWFETQFHHENESSVSVVGFRSRLVDGFRFAHGSAIVPDLVIANDQRFARYRDRLAIDLRGASLEVACEWARTYVELCSDPLAAEVDPLCKAIGGHLHMATVTPKDGFQWVVKPII